MNEEEHKRHRRLVSAPFQKGAVEAYTGQLVNLAERLIQDWRPGEVRDVFSDMTRYMLQVTSTLLFGFDLPELAQEVGRLTQQWVALNHEVGIGALVSVPDLAPCYDRLLALAETLEARIRTMIAHRRTWATLGNDVLSLLLRASQVSGAGLSDAELIGQTAILFAAAHMTTANTLTWTLFLLAQHPRVASDLVEELRSKLQGKAPTGGHLEQLGLLQRVVSESMRVLPASFYSQRVSTARVDLGPFQLAPGSLIVWSQFMTHHLPELYPDPEQFRPERWLTIRPSPYAYLPFGAGPRMCLGGPLALLTIKITLATLFQHFGLKVVPGATIQGKVRGTMLAPELGMPMQILALGAPGSCSPVKGNVHEMVTLAL
jgi:cytochrome P450